MKLLKDLAQKDKDVEKLSDQNDKLVHFIMSSKGYISLNPPKWSREIEKCPFCGGREFFLWMVDKEKQAWGCGRVCLGSKLPSNVDQKHSLHKNKRAILWHLFCENNGIGDEYYDVKFENLQQTQGKIDYMLKFATTPRGIILMRGEPGTGKTYAAMAICEYFTRQSSFCVFTTQKKMSSNWLLAQSNPMDKFVSNINSTPLLVVDDFATGEPNPKFLEFFMDVINTRLQWKTRGTIITTNLNMKSFNDFCGAALADRIMTGQIFNFEGKTRRKKIIL